MSGAIRTGVFPFFEMANLFDVWRSTPLDQGGRLRQLGLMGWEEDGAIAVVLRDPKFFATWGEPGTWRWDATKPELSSWQARGYFWRSLAREYYVHGDRGLLDDLLRWLRAWAAGNPAPKDTHAYFKTKDGVWRDMQVAWRTLNLTWVYFLGGDGFTDGERAELYGMIGENARVLHDYFGAEPLAWGNHQSHAGLAMLCAGVLFPDLPIAEVLKTDGILVLEHHVSAAFFADGNSVELSPGYFPFIASIFRDAMMIGKANGVEVKGVTDRVGKCRDFLRRAVQPDGSMSPINDSSETPAEVFLKTLDMCLGGTGAEIGSHNFESSGQVVMRDGGNYVFVDAGPLIFWHWHGGKMGFEFWFGGGRFMVDSGVCDYDDPERVKWFCTPGAHNSLLVDGRGDYEREKLKFDGSMSADCRVVDWQSEAGFDCVTMVHDGFAKRSGMRWMRTICLAKGMGFLMVVDQVVGGEAHAVGLPFHFAQGVVVEKDGGWRWSSGDRQGDFLCGDPGAFDERVISAGLVNREGKNVAAPMVTFSGKGAVVRAAFVMGMSGWDADGKLSVTQKVNGDWMEVSGGRWGAGVTVKVPVFSGDAVETLKGKVMVEVGK